MKPYFEQNKNQSGIVDIDRPYYVGCQSTQLDGYYIPPHWHYHMEFIYMAYGTATVTIGCDVYQVYQGDTVLIYPCEVHSVSVAAMVPSQHYVIGFDPELLRPMPQLAFQFSYMLPYAATLTDKKHIIPSDTHSKDMLLLLIEEMHGEYVSKTPGFELAVAGAVYKLVVHLIRQHEAHLFRGAEHAVESGRKLDSFRSMLIHLNENCHEAITAADAAKRSMMSYSRFADLFKQVMQTSFTPYLLFLRIRKAEQQLLDPSLSITQISLDTGFNSPSYFIKHFKRAKGISPMQYRKLMLSQHGNSDQ